MGHFRRAGYSSVVSVVPALGLQDSDAADLVQEVLLLLYRKLPEFDYQRGGSFRGWEEDF